MFTGIEPLEDGLYYKNRTTVGDMVKWNNQKIKIRGEPLKATRLTSIAFGATKDEPGITIVNHLLKEIATIRDPITTIKTRQDIEQETNKDLSQQEYDDLKIAVTNMLREYGMSWETLTYQGIGPHHQGLTRLLNWKEKGSKHFYKAIRAKINRPYNLREA